MTNWKATLGWLPSMFCNPDSEESRGDSGGCVPESTIGPSFVQGGQAFCLGRGFDKRSAKIEEVKAALDLITDAAARGG